MHARALLLPALLFASASHLAAFHLPLTVRNALPESRANVPVTWAVPLAISDNVRDAGTLRLVTSTTQLPAQFTPLARWGGRVSDSSKPISWILIDTRVDLPAGAALGVTLQDVAPANETSPLRVTRNDAGAITIETGAATYEMSKSAFRLFDRVTLANGTAFAGPGALTFNGQVVSAPCSLAVEHQGRERISLIGRGTIEGGLEYTIRLHFHRNLAEVKIDFRLENLTAPRITDGQPQDNDYGSQGSVSFDDLTLSFATNGGTSWEMPAGELGASGTQSGSFASGVSVVQESSGDDRWDALRSLAPRLQSAVAKRTSTRRIDGTVTDGPNRVAGWLDAGGVTVAVESAWQNFPKALRATSARIDAGIFPGEYAANHQLRPGEFKTHTVWVRHHASGVNDVALRARSALAPPRLVAAAEHSSRTRAAGLMAPSMRAHFPDYENGVDWQFTESPEWREGEYEARTVLDAISRSQCLGWVDYGDIPTDFEVATSPYNMKYDVLRGLIHHALRSDDDDLWRFGAAAARHVADFDVHHSRVRGPKAQRLWFEGGIYGHGYHDEDGRLNPHRNYMNTSSSMAGPAAGLFVWALATGDTLLMDSAVESADNLYWKTTNTNYDEAAPGAAACAIAAGLQGCGDTCEGYEPADVSRTGGNIAQAMIAAYQATGDATYLDLVGSIAKYASCVETSIIPQTCNRFHFQTVFVRSVGHYLILRGMLGMTEDTVARELLRKRIDYMTTTLWDAGAQRFRMCYYDDVIDTTLTPIEDNWLFGVADAFAVGSIVLNRPELLTTYGEPLFRFGAANQFYAGSAISYHSAKEFVNQLGFGQMFLHARWSTTADETTRKRPVRRK